MTQKDYYPWKLYRIPRNWLDEKSPITGATRVDEFASQGFAFDAARNWNNVNADQMFFVVHGEIDANGKVALASNGYFHVETENFDEAIRLLAKEAKVAYDNANSLLSREVEYPNVWLEQESLRSKAEAKESWDDEYCQDTCDTCGNTRHLRRLQLSADSTGSHLYLCMECWKKEMNWRTNQNTFGRAAFQWKVYGFFAEIN